MHSIYRFRARLATVLSLRPLYFSVEPSRCAGESDGLQIKGIAQNSCRARFDAHSKRGTESSNPPPSSGESTNHRVLGGGAASAAQPSKPQPAQTAPQPGSMEWLAEQEKSG